jgi:hypothetical protein
MGMVMKHTAAAALALGVTIAAISAEASTKKSPLWTGRKERETELSLQRWETPAVLERRRSFGRKNAVFHAEPQAIAPDAVLVFEVASEGKLRWRCIAVDDVAECLGAPVRIPYQKTDEVLRMSVQAVPRDTPKGSELVREAKQGQKQRLFAKG